MKMNDRPKIEWRSVKMFPDPSLREGQRTPLVEVMKSSHHPYPRYRIQLCTALDTKAVVLGIQPKVEGQNVVKSTVDWNLELPLTELERAKQWIIEDADYEANRWQSMREAKDVQRANFGKPVMRVTGKTAKKKAKLAARAAGLQETESE